jgi:hypothetical protein
MSKRTVFTTVTPLPAGITRETVMETLHNHLEMIDLNPLVEERHPIKPPSEASPEEFYCLWYSLTDRVSYLPGGLASGRVSYNACFHDLDRGLQTHCYAPMGLNIKGKWTLGGSLPGEPVAPVELGIGAPLSGLYLREDVDMKCNIMMTPFVKKTLKGAHSRLVDRLVVKAQFEDHAIRNEQLSQSSLLQTQSRFSGSQAAADYSPSDYGDARASIEDGSIHSASSRFSHQSVAPQLPAISNPEFRISSPDFRGRTNGFEIQAAQAAHPASLTVRRASHVRSLSEQRPQAPYPDYYDTNAPPARAASSGSSYDASERPPSERQPLPYPESTASTPRAARASWQSPPSNHNASMEELDIAFTEAAPAYHDYATAPSMELPANDRQYGGGRRGDRTYDGVPRVYGAAELA